MNLPSSCSYQGPAWLKRPPVKIKKRFLSISQMLLATAKG